VISEPSATQIAGPALLRLIHQLIVVRASGKLADHQRGYPRWELPNNKLHCLLEAGVGGVILLGGSAAEVAPSCAAGPVSRCCSAPMWRREWASVSTAPLGWCHP
jgi:beta-glucosidase